MIGSRQRKQFFVDEAKTDELRKVLLIPFKAETLLSLVDSLIHGQILMGNTSPFEGSRQSSSLCNKQD